MAQKTLSWAPKHAGELVSRLSNATTAQLDDLTHLKDAISRRVATLDAQKSRARKGRTVQSKPPRGTRFAELIEDVTCRVADAGSSAKDALRQLGATLDVKIQQLSTLARERPAGDLEAASPADLAAALTGIAACMPVDAQGRLAWVCAEARRLVASPTAATALVFGGPVRVEGLTTALAAGRFSALVSLQAPPGDMTDNEFANFVDALEGGCPALKTLDLSLLPYAGSSKANGDRWDEVGIFDALAWSTLALETLKTPLGANEVHLLELQRLLYKIEKSGRNREKRENLETFLEHARDDADRARHQRNLDRFDRKVAVVADSPYGKPWDESEVPELIALERGPRLYNEMQYPPRNCILSLSQVKRIKRRGGGLRVVQPQWYRGVTTLDRDHGCVQGNNQYRDILEEEEEDGEDECGYFHGTRGRARFTAHFNLAKKEYEEDLALTGGAGDVWWVADKKLLKFLKAWDAWATDRSQPMPDEVEYFKKCDPNVPRLKPLSRSDYLGGAGWFPIGTFL